MFNNNSFCTKLNQDLNKYRCDRFLYKLINEHHHSKLCFYGFFLLYRLYEFGFIKYYTDIARQDVLNILLNLHLVKLQRHFDYYDYYILTSAGVHFVRSCNLDSMFDSLASDRNLINDPEHIVYDRKIWLKANLKWACAIVLFFISIGYLIADLGILLLGLIKAITNFGLSLASLGFLGGFKQTVLILSLGMVVFFCMSINIHPSSPLNSDCSLSDLTKHRADIISDTTHYMNFYFNQPDNYLDKINFLEIVLNDPKARQYLINHCAPSLQMIDHKLFV